MASTGISPGSEAGGGITGATFLDLFFVAFRAVPLLVIFLAAFFVVFFAAFFVPFLAAAFLVDFLAALADFFAPPRALDFDALFFAALPPLRAPLDFLLPFLAAMGSLLYFVLSLAQRNKII
ncbi:MAG TPA: hypothetical protein VHS05_10250 [Pyrinomonadaceae bacterium]|nr:hypothetical protein [Pyrinomonadaceae bacterium]